MLKKVLKSQGYRVEVMNDGYDAMGRLLGEHFDLLVTGLEIKRLNGLALVSAVQKSGLRTSKIKTVLLTTTQLQSTTGNPVFVVKKDASLKEKFKEIVIELTRK